MKNTKPILSPFLQTSTLFPTATLVILKNQAQGISERRKTTGVSTENLITEDSIFSSLHYQ